MDEVKVPIAFDKLVKDKKYYLNSEKYSGYFTVTGNTQKKDANNRSYDTVDIEFYNNEKLGSDDNDMLVENKLGSKKMGSKKAVLCSTKLDNYRNQIRFYFKRVPTFDLNPPIKDGEIVLNPEFISTITEKNGGGKRRHKKSRKVRRNRRNKTYRTK